MPPRKAAGSAATTATRTRRARAATTATTRQRAPTASSLQQIIWQGASLNGLNFYRVTRAGNVWALFAAPIGTAATLAFKPVTSLPMCIDALAAMGTQYAGLTFGAAPMTGLANRSIPRTAANAIPSAAVATNQPVATQRVRRRVSVKRSAAVATT